MFNTQTLYLIGVELRLAREKYPTNENLLPALMEEVGELAAAVLQVRFAVMRGDTPAQIQQQRDKIRREALQVITVAGRIIEEGVAEYPETETPTTEY